MSAALTLFAWLLVAHAVCDYPLQGDFLARAKNHRAPLPNIPAWQALWWHAVMHAGAVAWLTGVPALGVCELIAHMAIDWAKCEGWTDFNVDQALHVACKGMWVALLA